MCSRPVLTFLTIGAVISQTAIWTEFEAQYVVDLSKYLVIVIQIPLKSTGTRFTTYWASISAQIQLHSTNIRKVYTDTAQFR